MAKTIGLIILIILSLVLGFAVLTIFGVIEDYFGLNDIIGNVVEAITSFK